MDSGTGCKEPDLARRERSTALPESDQCSYRRASAGSVLIARITGTAVAAAATTVTNTMAAAIDVASCGETLNSIERIPDAATDAAPSPAMIPATTIPRVRLAITFAVSRRPGPSALRIASYRRLWVAMYASDPYIPAPANSAAHAPTLDARMAVSRSLAMLFATSSLIA
jgi:hypothetical protein